MITAKHCSLSYVYLILEPIIFQNLILVHIFFKKRSYIVKDLTLVGGYHYNYCSVFFYKNAFLSSKISEDKSLNFNINLTTLKYIFDEGCDV